MMQPIVLRLQLFAGPNDRERSQVSLLWFLEALCKHNQGLLEHFPYPPLYQSGVRYKREEGTEEWQDIPNVLKTGWGDCEDLACWRVAELRRQRIKASPYARFRQINGVYHYHAMVQRYRADGSKYLEDPSRKLGMTSSKASEARA
jgi:hypothetical protein